MESKPTTASLSALGSMSALGLCILFGGNTIAIKISILDLGVYFTAGMRFIIASLGLIAWAAATRRSLFVPRKNWLPLLVISFFFSAQLLCFYTGISKTTASRSALITNLQPFFVLLLAHFFIPGDRINLKKIIGITLAFSGLAFIFFDHTVADSQLRSGDFIVLGGAFIWGCNAIFIKKVIHRFPPLHIALFPMIAATPIALTTSFFLDSQIIKDIHIETIAAVLYQSTMAAFGFVAWNTLLKRHGAVALHSFVFVMPIVGVSLGGLILDEPITTRLLLGLLFVVSGLLVIHFKRQKPIRPFFTIGRNL